MELTVGITELKPHWQILLDQIGVPYREISPDDSLDAEKYAALIMSASPTPHRRERILKFLSGGGAVLAEADDAAQLLDLSLKRVTVKYLNPDRDELFSNIPLCDLKSDSWITSNAQYLPNQNGIKTTTALQYQNGKVIILPSNLCSAVLRYGEVARKNFPSSARRFPSEKVSRVSTGSVRHVVQRALMNLFHGRRLPFAQLWNFPNGGKSMFAFRVDTDAASKAQVEELYHVCSDNAISAAWFVHTRAHENWIDYFARMENQEIGYHCYRHRVYPDAHAMQTDMEKGLRLLESIGIQPRGYAAPLGEWNFDLARLVEKRGFAYSSEFGCAYDDLPFFPYLKTGFSSVLQAPIHPISTRGLLLAKHDENQMIDYYLNVMEQKLLLNEPIIFYHHPIHGNLRVFEEIFKAAKERNIPNMNLDSYHSWWRKRLQTEWTAKFDSSRISLSAAKSDPSIWVKATFPDQQSYLMALNQPENQIPLAIPVRFNLSAPDPRKLRRITLQFIWQEIEAHYGRLRQ